MPTKKPTKTLKLRLLLGCALFLFILLMVIWFAYGILNRYSENNKWVINSQTVILKLESVENDTRKLESDARGYVLSKGKNSFTSESKKVVNNIPENIDELESLVKDNSEQLNRIEELRIISQNRLQVLTKVTDLVDQNDYQAIDALIKINIGNIYMQQLVDKLSEIKTAERKLLEERIQNVNQSTENTKNVFLIIALLSILFVIISYLIVNHSINRRYELEKATMRSEGKLRTLTEKARDAIITVTVEGKILSWNKSAEEIFGWTSEEAVGQNLSMIVPESYREAYIAGMKRFAKTETSELLTKPIILEGLSKSDRIFPIELAISYWKYENEGFLTGFIRDVTERKLAEETLALSEANLKRSNAELEQFAYIASHDLQEPLRMVSSYCGLLKRRYKDKLGTDGLEMVEFAVDGAERMKTLIQSLLTYSRAGRDYEFHKIKLNEVCKVVQEQLTPLLNETNAKINFNDLPVVFGEGILLTQLFQNLIINGIKFRKKDELHPVVNISVEKADKEWIFSVKDNGIGIDNKFYDKLFVIFQRLHSREEYEGTGIGLALCKKIVEKHKGTIWVESELGKGTTFHFTLPMMEI